MADARDLVAKLRRLAADDAATPAERATATEKADALEARLPSREEEELLAFRDALGALASVGERMSRVGERRRARSARARRRTERAAAPGFSFVRTGPDFDLKVYVDGVDITDEVLARRRND